MNNVICEFDTIEAKLGLGVDYYKGEKGDKGEPGPVGPRGEQGPAGEKGADGPIGPTGDSGVYRGSVEPTDATIKVWLNPAGDASKNLATVGYVDEAIKNVELTPGPEGPQGPAGTAGPAGKDALINNVNTLTIVEGKNIKLQQDGNQLTISSTAGGGGGAGENGATFTPSVSPEGEISWTNDKGLDNPTPVNIKGPKGDTGAPGADGIQGPQGPIGEKGEQGLPGKDGAQGPEGPAGQRGEPGQQGIPGEKGADGAPGKDGAQGAIGPEGPAGKDGKDYVLTEQDKQEIANITLGLIPDGNEVKY